MPEVDFMVICDYARAEDGLLHIVAAGIDRVMPDVLPAARNLGIAIRLRLDASECDNPHTLQLIFRSKEGGKLLDMHAEISADYPDGIPPGWQATAVVPLNIGVPLPEYGQYSFELNLNGQSKKSVPLLVSPPLRTTRRTGLPTTRVELREAQPPTSVS